MNSGQLFSSFVHGVSSHFRRQRSRFFTDTLPDFRRMRICDVGGSVHFWEKQEPSALPDHVTIVNVTTDGTTTAHAGTLSDARFDFLLYDGHRLPFEDKQFDVAVCNSVIEHVPLAQRQNLVNEVRRVARHYFIQTPAFVFPVEPHFVFPFLHWLPRSLAKRLVYVSPWRLFYRPDPQYIADYYEEIHILTLRELQSYAPGATLMVERLLGIPKSYVLYGRG